MKFDGSSTDVLVIGCSREHYRTVEVATWLSEEDGARITVGATRELLGRLGPGALSVDGAPGVVIEAGGRVGEIAPEGAATAPMPLADFVAARGIGSIVAVGWAGSNEDRKLVRALAEVARGKAADVTVAEALGPGRVRSVLIPPPEVEPGGESGPEGIVWLAPAPTGNPAPLYPFLETLLSARRLARGRRRGDLLGARLIITAGGTREPIDPVRFIGNHSSGKMGRELARAALDRGASVSLVATEVLREPILGARFALAESVARMREVVLALAEDHHGLIMSAALSDYRCASPATQKIKKEPGGFLDLRLITQANFIPELPEPLLKVGFAAETENVERHATEKRRRRGFDIICANDVSRQDIGFASEYNEVLILDERGERARLARAPKNVIAWQILDAILPDLHRAMSRRGVAASLPGPAGSGGRR